VSTFVDTNVLMRLVTGELPKMASHATRLLDGIRRVVTLDPRGGAAAADRTLAAGRRAHGEVWITDRREQAQPDPQRLDGYHGLDGPSDHPPVTAEDSDGTNPGGRVGRGIG